MSDPIESMNPESWQYSRGYAGVFGNPPAPFVGTIRAVMMDFASGDGRMSNACRYQVLRLLKSPTFFAPFYFACKAFDPQAISPNIRTSEACVLKSFDSFEVACLLGIIYTWRRAQTLCSTDEFKYLQAALIDEINAAFVVGRIIPEIGGGTALIKSAFPVLGLSAFLRHDPKGFQEYRRYLKQRGAGWDLENEAQRWGCNHLQIGSVMVQSLGYGVKRANALVHGLASNTDTGSPEEVELVHAIRMTSLWAEAIRTTRQAPQVKMASKYYPLSEDLQRGLRIIDDLEADKSLKHWIIATKDDLPAFQIPAEREHAPQTPTRPVDET